MFRAQAGRTKYNNAFFVSATINPGKIKQLRIKHSWLHVTDSDEGQVFVQLLCKCCLYIAQQSMST